MKLTLKRRPSHEGCTLGDLSIDGVWECFTLEDVVREVKDKPVAEWKIQNKTAIPAGTYSVVIDYSPRFQRKLPHLLAVPGFVGIRIHSGNTAENTEGCILVGQKITTKAITGGTSRPALTALQTKLQAALDDGQKVTLTIT